MKSRRDNKNDYYFNYINYIYINVFYIFNIILSSIMESYLAVYNYAFVGNHIGI